MRNQSEEQLARAERERNGVIIDVKVVYLIVIGAVCWKYLDVSNKQVKK